MSDYVEIEWYFWVMLGLIGKERKRKGKDIVLFWIKYEATSYVTSKLLLVQTVLRQSF